MVKALNATGLADIVALCDTDMGAPHTQGVLKMFPNVPRFQDFRKLFDKLGKSVTLVGDVGAGQVAKACNQILTGVTVAAVAEAFNLARRSGVDPGRVREALMGG